MRRGVAIAGVVLAAAVAAAVWWWPSCGEARPGETASPAAGGVPSSRQAAGGVTIEVSGGGAAAGSTFSGRVVDGDDGRPIPRATVTFFLGGAHDAVTDAEGTFRFEAPRPGTYELRRVAADGYAPFTADPLRGTLRFVARPGAAVGGLQFELSPLIRCTGTVHRDGELAAGARVRCTDGDEPISEATTDEDGAFAIMCARRHVLQVAGEGPLNLGAFGRVDPDPECRWDAQLSTRPDGPPFRPDHVVAVHVADGQGRPVPHAMVACTALNPGEPFSAAKDRFQLLLIGSSPIHNTDEAGVMQCREPDGKEVSAFVRGYPSSERRASVDAGELTLEVPSPGRLQGRVRDFDGKPMGAFLVVARTDEGQLYGQPFVSGDGTFDLGELVPGLYEVTAEASGLPPSRAEPVEISPGATAEADLTIEEGRAVRGVVLDADTKRPIPGARIARSGSVMLEWPLSEPKTSTTTDLNGRFAIRRLSRDESLVVSAPGYNQWEVADREVQLRDLTIELTPAGADAGSEFGGVGINWGDAFPVVGSVVPGGPAERAGVDVGDRLARIDGSPSPEQLSQVVALVRGPVGSMVELGFERPDGGSLDVSLRRERIALPW